MSNPDVNASQNQGGEGDRDKEKKIKEQEPQIEQINQNHQNHNIQQPQIQQSNDEHKNTIQIPKNDEENKSQLLKPSFNDDLNIDEVDAQSQGVVNENQIEIQINPQQNVTQEQEQGDATYRFNLDPQTQNQHEDWYQELENINKQYVEHLGDEFCCVELGWHNCCSTSLIQTKLMRLGVGINLYFRFMNSIGCLYLVLSILALPQILLSIFSFKQSGQQYSGDPSTWLMSTTIGAIGLNNKVCYYGTFQYSNSSLDVSLTCRNGNLDFSQRSLVLGLVESSENNCYYITSQDLYSDSYQSELKGYDCDGKVNCNIQLDQSNFPNYDISGKHVILSVQCKDSYIDFTIFRINNEIAPLIIGFADAAMMVAMIIYLLNLQQAESNYQYKMNKAQPQLEYFSLQVSVPQKLQNNQQLINQIKNHLEQYMKKIDKSITIYDICTSESLELIDLQKQLKYCKQKMEFRIQSLIESGNQVVNIADQNKSVLIKQSQLPSQFEKFMGASPPAKKAKLQKQNEGINKLQQKQKELQEKISKIQKEQKIKYLWVTFSSMEGKLQTQEEFQTLFSDWFLYKCCMCCFNDQSKEKQILIENQRLKVINAPNPDNIQWNNLNYTSKERLIRRFISFLGTAVILCISFFIISLVNHYRRQIQQEYPNVDCDLYEVTAANIENYINLYQSNETVQNYIICYCKNNIQAILNNDVTPAIKNACQDQIENILLQQSLPFLAAGFLILINIFIQYSFRLITQFEKHQNISDEYMSRSLKIFLAQFLNTGLIILISNIDFKNQNADSIVDFLFGGKYGDIDSQWCLNVGIIVLWTLLINTLTFPIVMMLDLLLYKIQVMLDRSKCSGDSKMSQCKTKEEFLELHLGLNFYLDLRYSQILTSMFVCFIYSAALPFLYLTTFFTIFFLYWFDKFGIFKIYREPEKFDRSLSIMLKRFMWFGIIVHCAFAIYIYGSSNLFYQTKTLVNIDLVGSFSSSDYVKIWWDRAFTQSNNIALIAILGILLVVNILIIFFYKPLKICITGCTSSIKDKLIRSNIIKSGSGQPILIRPLEMCKKNIIFKVLTKDQLEIELKILEKLYPEKSKLFKNKMNAYKNERKIYLDKMSLTQQNKVNIKSDDGQIPMNEQKENQENANNNANINSNANENDQLIVNHKPNIQLIGLPSYNIMVTIILIISIISN